MEKRGIRLRNRIAAGAGLLMGFAMAGTLLAARPAPAPVNIDRPARLAGGKPFASVCKSNQVVDLRPEPAWIGAGFAGDNCRAPPLPRPVDGSTASREAVMAGIAAAKRYDAAAESFQRCVRDFVAAGGGKPLSRSTVIIENHRILASEKDKQQVAALVRATINAFNEYGSECAE